jgi:ubiquinone/menaquinone biosynthesis C-methylase UbiE
MSVSPALIFDTMTAHVRSQALLAAIELDLFTAIAQTANTAPAIATNISCSPRGTRILCDYLVMLGFLTKLGGAYALTPDSAAFLDKRSPAYMGGTAQFMLGNTLVSAYNNLAQVVKTGRTNLDGQGTVETDHPVWQDFARSMAPMMMLQGQLIANRMAGEVTGPCKVLDIAAGHGMFGILIAQANPQAEIYALDWPKVLDVASENALKFGVAARHHRIEGDAFQVGFGHDYDIVLLTNFVHHFDAETNIRLYQRVHAALKPGGRCVTLEFIPNPDRVSPPIPAGFAMVMLATTPSGDAYTFSELEAMASAAGFSRCEFADLAPSPQQIVVSYK